MRFSLNKTQQQKQKKPQSVSLVVFKSFFC